MFIRPLKSKNGKTYIQVVDKSSGKYKVIKSFGGSDSLTEQSKLKKKAQDWINNYKSNQEFDFTNSNEQIEQFFQSINQLHQVGFDLLLGKLFNEIQLENPNNGEIVKRTLLLTDEQKYLASIFNFGC